MSYAIDLAHRSPLSSAPVSFQPTSPPRATSKPSPPQAPLAKSLIPQRWHHRHPGGIPDRRFRPGHRHRQWQPARSYCNAWQQKSRLRYRAAPIDRRRSHCHHQRHRSQHQRAHPIRLANLCRHRPGRRSAPHRHRADAHQYHRRAAARSAIADSKPDRSKSSWMSMAKRANRSCPRPPTLMRPPTHFPTRSPSSLTASHRCTLPRRHFACPCAHRQQPGQ